MSEFTKFMKRAAMVLIPLVLIVGCSGGGGDDPASASSSSSSTSSGGGLPAAVTLKSAINPTLKEESVIATTLTRQNGDPIVGATVTMRSRIGNTPIVAGSGVTDPNGVKGLVAAAGTYDYIIAGLPATVGNYSGKLTVTAAATQTNSLQTSEQKISVAATGITTATVRIHQLDSSDEIVNIFSPNLSVTSTVVVNDIIDITTELFAGRYRFVVSGADAAGNFATQMTDIITISGQGATESTQTVNLSTSGNAVALTLLDEVGAALPNYHLTAVDATTGLQLGTATTDGAGVGSFNIHSGFNNVAIYIQNAATFIEGIYINASLTATDITTLQKRTVSGAVEPPAGSALDATDTASITFDIADLPAKMAEVTYVTRLSELTAMTPGTGIYTRTLFPGSYSVKATGVQGFPDVTPTAITVVGVNLPNTNVAVAVGSIITGRIQDQANNNQANVEVQIFPANSLTDNTVRQITSVMSNAQGIYSAELPYGTYDLWVGGSVITNLTVSSTVPTLTRNITRFQVTGRVIDELNAGVQAVYSNPGISSVIGATTISGPTTAASTLGIFTGRLYEGLATLCYTPPASRSTLGSQCFFSTDVNATAVDAL